MFGATGLKLLAAASALGAAWSQDSGSETIEASALLQATTAVLVDSDAELELDSGLELEELTVNDAKAQQVGAVEVGSQLATAYMIGRLTSTADDVECLANASAQCFGGLATLADTVGDCLDHAQDILSLSLIQAVPGTATALEFASEAATKWHTTAEHLTHEAEEFTELGQDLSLDQKVGVLSSLITELGIQAQEDEELFSKAYDNCLALPGVSTLTSLCEPFQNWYYLMNGHYETSLVDLSMLQQFHGAVKAAPELAFLQGRRVTSIKHSDNLSIKTVSKLQQLLNHQQKVLKQVQESCKDFGKMAKTTLDVANAVPGIDISDKETAVNDVISGGAAECS